jgi:O-antigen ligase
MVDRDTAVEAATFDLPSRYRGLGENPNTSALLLALALPIAGWFALRAQSRRGRVAAAAAVLFLAGSIAASLSRGALVAAFAGLLVAVALAPAGRRARIAGAAATLVLLGVCVAVQLVPEPRPQRAAAAPTAPAPSAPRRYVDAQKVFPLEFDIGPGMSVRRSILGSSGRRQAWSGAIDQAAERPALGYGFGTESQVFVDRYSTFAGGLPENSYIGLALQVGILGLLSFIVLVAVVLERTVRLRHRPIAAATVGVVVAALVLAGVQSYIYSVGNIGTATVWICAFVGATLGGPADAS